MRRHVEMPILAALITSTCAGLWWLFDHADEVFGGRATFLLAVAIGCSSGIGAFVVTRAVLTRVPMPRCGAGCSGPR